MEIKTTQTSVKRPKTAEKQNKGEVRFGKSGCLLKLAHRCKRKENVIKRLHPIMMITCLSCRKSIAWVKPYIIDQSPDHAKNSQREFEMR